MPQKKVSATIQVTAVIDGQNGIDAQDIEWAYIRTKTDTPPVIAADSSYIDSKGRAYTADDHLPHVTGNANIESNNSGVSGKTYECTDDPQGVEDEWPYEWEIKREKGAADANGHRAWQPFSGTMTLHNNLASSLLNIDIDNDSDQFGVDADGKVLAQQARSTVVTMAYGTELQAFTEAPTASLRYDDGTPVATTVAIADVAVVANTDSKQYRVTVTVKATGTNTPVFGKSGKNGLYVDINGTCSRGTKSVRFSLTKVMGGQNPVIWQLNPSRKSFVFGRDASNNLIPSSVASNISNIYVTRTEGNTTTEHTSASGLTNPPTFSWGFDSSSTPQATAQAIGTAISISNTQAASHSSVWVKLSTGDRETLPILKDGAKGQNGQPGTQRQRIYRSLNSGTYTGEFPSDADDADHPAGWSFTPTAISETVRYRYISERTSNNGGTTWSSWSSPVIDGYMAEDGTSIAIKGEAKGVVAWGESVPATGTAGDIWLLNNNSSDGDDYEIFLSGSESESLSANMGDGFLISGHLWQKVRETATSATLVRWKDVGQIQGPQGPPGDDAVTYTITLAGSVFVHNPNTGMLHVNIKGRAYKTVGGTTTNYYQMENQAQLSLYFLRQDGTEDELSRGDYIVNNDTFSTQYYDGCGYGGEEVFVAVMTINGREVARASIQIETDGLNGESIKGDTGRMYYIAGKWDSTKTYTRTDALCPVVYIATGTGVSAEWWYLDADTAQGDSQKPGDSSTLWKPVAGFGVVLTEAIFVKEFAQFCACIITGDWMISYYGKLYSDETEVMVVDHGDVENPMLYPEEITPNSPAYHYFNPEYPDQPGKGIINFVPQYAVDLKTGKVYMHDAYIKGEVHATSGVFNGTIKAEAMYMDYQEAVVGEVIDPANGAAIGIPEAYIGDRIYLPRAADYPYLTLTFHRYFPANETATIAVICTSKVADGADEDDRDQIYINSEVIDSTVKNCCHAFTPPANHVIRLHAINGQWYLDCDEEKIYSFYKVNDNGELVPLKRYTIRQTPEVHRGGGDTYDFDTQMTWSYETILSGYRTVVLPDAGRARGMRVHIKGGCYVNTVKTGTTVRSSSVIWSSHDITEWSKSGNLYTGNIQGYSHIFVSDGMRWIDFHCSMGQL